MPASVGTSAIVALLRHPPVLVVCVTSLAAYSILLVDVVASLSGSPGILNLLSVGVFSDRTLPVQRTHIEATCYASGRRRRRRACA
jgi:hypothetical protein